MVQPNIFLNNSSLILMKKKSINTIPSALHLSVNPQVPEASLTAWQEQLKRFE